MFRQYITTRLARAAAMLTECLLTECHTLSKV